MTRPSLLQWLVRLITVAALMPAIGCATSGRAAIIEPDEFARRVSSSTMDRLILLDARDAAAYSTGHVEGAAWADPGQWKDESLASDSGLSHAEIWRKRIGDSGIDGSRPVVIYDDGRMTEAARLWFILQHFGVPRAAVLNGGYRALQPMIESGRMRVSTAPSSPAPTRLTASPGGSIGLVDREELRREIDAGRVQVLDARTPDEYTGKDMRRNKRGGHLPTAINVPHTQLLDPSGRLKDAESLARILEDAGFRRGRPVVTHCDGGGRASLAALAAERAGYGPVMNYYLSFGDWSKDATCPVESGDVYETDGRQ